MSVIRPNHVCSATAYGGAGASPAGPVRPTGQRKRPFIWSPSEDEEGGQELHYIDLDWALYQANTTGNVTLINANIQVGTTEYRRVGRKVLLKSLQIRGEVLTDSSTTTTHVAWMIVYDKRPTGALPAVTDILKTAFASSFMNDANIGRFLVLHREDAFLVGPNAGSTATWTSATGYAVDRCIRLRDLPMWFKKAATGGITNIAEGALYLVCVGDQPSGTSDGLVRLGFRTRFLDC